MTKIFFVLLAALFLSCMASYTVIWYYVLASDCVYYTDAIIRNAQHVVKGTLFQPADDSVSQSSDVETLF
jgi:hypothetical protein